jgi:hypothetical protein
LPTGALKLGDLPTGTLKLGDLPTGALKLGDLPTGALKLGDLPTGTLKLGDLQTGTITLGDLATGNFKFGAAATGNFKLGDPLTGDLRLGDLSPGTFKLSDALAVEDPFKMGDWATESTAADDVGRHAESDVRGGIRLPTRTEAWLLSLAPVAQRRVFLAALDALSLLLIWAGAEAGIEQPAHLDLLANALISILALLNEALSTRQDG